MSETLETYAPLEPSVLAAARVAERTFNQSYKLLSVRVDDIPPTTLMDLIHEAVVMRKRLLVVNANAHLINLAQTRPWLVTLFDEADVAFCDGAGVQFACWLKTGHRPARHTPPEWIEPLAIRLAGVDASLYWLGGRPETVASAARQLAERTGLRVVGVRDGYFNASPDSAENLALLTDIERARPDLLLITMGMPLQERWLSENWSKLAVPVAITGGALVDHVAGVVKRPPVWVATCGFEWLFRLMIEPRRLWRRYLCGLPLFALRCLVSAAFE